MMIREAAHGWGALVECHIRFTNRPELSARSNAHREHGEIYFNLRNLAGSTSTSGLLLLLGKADRRARRGSRASQRTQAVRANEGHR